jgi:probable non-F420 flavinoid oxidoreductase
MARIGFHASHEQWPPSALLRQVRMAEQAGFDAAMCSDHFHPWSERQGESGFAWSWLGAALEATKLSFGTVCAPGQRYHPAIIAQAAATLAELYPGRFWLAVGSGEALNENITGETWPSKKERNDRLEECVAIMRDLWSGETVNHDGQVRVRQAKLYTRPEKPPPVIGAAVTPDTARWIGGWADGLITVGKDAADLREVVEAFREGGGTGKPIHLQIALSFAATEEEALRIAHDQWRQCALDPQQLSDLATPLAFDAATQAISPLEVHRRLRVSADIRQHLAWLQEALDIGFDAIYVHYLGANIDEFFDAFGSKVLPALRRLPQNKTALPGK